MPSTDKRIFTNNDGISLKQRMEALLKNTANFDILVGYFRITGFYLLKKSLETVDKVRILVGLGADDETVVATQTVSIFDQGYYKTFPKLKNKIKEEFNDSADSIDVENGILTFIEWVKNKKVEIKMCPDKNVHAKVYIFKNNATISEYSIGSVITGSSNFSYTGLEKNIEFNIESKDPNDFAVSLQFFNDLWAQAIDITSDIQEVVENETWMNAQITPYELFIKTLIEYFEEELADDDYQIPLPANFLDLAYQKDAVKQARKIIEKHGGVFISDVVGLGKTYICAMLGKLLKGRKLFIVPPVVKDYWQDVLKDFDYSMKDEVVSLGIVDQLASRPDINDFSYIFVDEAHRFRNAESKEYQYLHQICFGRKGVILITATPQNNYITDIINLIALFQDKNESSIIPGNPNLDEFFRTRRRELASAKGTPDYESIVNAAMNDVRTQVLKHVMIRRTRKDVTTFYADDLSKQHLSFPKLHDHERITYTYSDEMDKTFNNTIVYLKKLKYARYTPLLYLIDKSKLGDRKSGQDNIRGFIKEMLVKRLESSIYAFKKSIARIYNNMLKFKELVDADKIIVGAASRKIELSDLEAMTEEELFELLDTKDLQMFKKSELESDFITDLESDIDVLKTLNEMWSNFDEYNDDKKFDTLVEKLSDIKRNNDKLIIFSESKETVEYLEERLNKKYNGRVVSFCGGDKDNLKEYIKRNFDPQNKQPLDEKSILIATDAMSESINLHRASAIINYDLPWNPTRIMQRVGRINRVGSKYTDIYTYNFFPAANTRGELSLEEAIKIKIQMFHTLLGEDAKYISEEEHITSQQFFDMLLASSQELGEEDEFSENASKMKYLKIARDVKKNDITFYNKVKELPRKLRLARKCEKDTYLLSFVKKGLIKEFFSTDGTITNNIDFDTAIKMIEADKEETRIDLPNKYYDFLGLNTAEFKEKIASSFNNGYNAKGTPKNLKLIKQYIALFNSAKATGQLSYEEKNNFDDINNLIERGVLTNYVFKEIIKNIKALDSKDVHSLLKCFMDTIPPIYFKDKVQPKIVDISNEKEVVVLSEFFIKSGDDKHGN